MTRKAQMKRVSKFAIAALTVIAGAGLISRFIFSDSALNDISLGSIAAVAATSGSYTVTSPLALPLMPNVIVNAGQLSVTGPNPQRKLTGSDAIALLSSGKARLVFDNALFSLVPTQSTEVDHKKNTSPVAPLLAALLKVSFSHLLVRNAIVQLGREEDEQQFLTNVNLEVTKLDTKQVRVAGTFAFKKKPVTFEIVMGIEAQLQGKQHDGKGTIGRAFDIKLTSDLLALSAAGTLSAGDQPQLSSTSSTLTVSDLRKLAQWVGLDLGTGGGLGKFEARGPFEFSPSAIAFTDASLSLDGNEATGTFTYKWGDRSRPEIDGTIAFKSFDIAPFFASTSRAGTSLPARIADYLSLSPNQTSAVLLADQIDADLRISAATVSAGATRFGRGAASLSLKNGVLLTDLAELEMSNGARCGGQFGLQVVAGVPLYSLRGKIETIDLAVLTSALWSHSVLSGTGDVTVDLKANGRDASQIIATMNGKAGVRQSGSGQIELDMRTLAATARAQPQKGWGGAIRGQTAIQGLQADFTMENGRLVAEQVAARAGDATLSTEGSLDFRDKIGDLKIWITHPSVPGAQSASDPNLAKVNPVTGNSPATGSETSVTAKAPQSPGGGLQIRGPLDAPEIQFIPIGPAPTGDANDPQTRPQVPTGSADKG